MKTAKSAGLAGLVLLGLGLGGLQMARGDAKESAGKEAPGLAEARRTAAMLDEIYKKTIVLVTDKYVHSEEDFAAGSAAVLLFEQISSGGTHEVRLLDATGQPYDEANVARDSFEKQGIQKLKKGAGSVEELTSDGDQKVLRVLTPVPVVMEKCVMCHEHYKQAKPGEPIGAISYSIPLH